MDSMPIRKIEVEVGAKSHYARERRIDLDQEGNHHGYKIGSVMLMLC